jgi:hypothetical protein
MNEEDEQKGFFLCDFAASKYGGLLIESNETSENVESEVVKYFLI